MEDININLDKNALNKFKENIKFFKSNDQYLVGFHYKKTFEIINLKVFNNNLFELIQDKYKYIIINVPITTKKNVINNLQHLSKYKIGKLIDYKITSYFLFQSQRNLNDMIQLRFQTNMKKLFKLVKLKKEIYKYFKQEKKICQIKCMFDEKTLEKLSKFLNNKNETGGIFRIKSINHKILGTIYSIYFHEKTHSGKEEVDIIDTHYNFHTHPQEAYLNHNCQLGWPSIDDLLSFLYTFINYDCYFHVVSTIEGLYVLTIDQSCLFKLKKQKDIPTHLEKWIDKNLYVNKDNFKLAEGKYVPKFGYIRSGDDYARFINTKKYPKWKCNIFSVIFLSWDMLKKDIYPYFSVNILKRNGKCIVKKI